MFKTAFGAVFGLAFAFAAWRNLPRLEYPVLQSAVLLVLIALYVTFRAGRDWRRKEWDHALAVAASEARAAASAEVHAFNEAKAAVTLNLNAPGVHANGIDLDQAVQLFADEGLDLDPEQVAEILATDLGLALPIEATGGVSRQAAGQASEASAEQSEPDQVLDVVAGPVKRGVTSTWPDRGSTTTT